MPVSAFSAKLLNLFSDSRSSSAARLRSVISRIMMIILIGLPSEESMTAALTSPIKRVPSCLIRVYSRSAKVPSVSRSSIFAYAFSCSSGTNIIPQFRPRTSSSGECPNICLALGEAKVSQPSMSATAIASGHKLTSVRCNSSLSRSASWARLRSVLSFSDSASLSRNACNSVISCSLVLS